MDKGEVGEAQEYKMKKSGDSGNTCCMLAGNHPPLNLVIHRGVC